MRFGEHKGCSRLLHSEQACSMMNALCSASRCMPQGQGLALHAAADKVGRNAVTASPWCRCTKSMLQHRYAFSTWVAATTCIYALVALPATLQMGKVCHHAYSTPLHVCYVQSRELCTSQLCNSRWSIWKQARNSTCVHGHCTNRWLCHHAQQTVLT